MNLKFFRYNEDFYIIDGRIENKILNILSIFNIVEKNELKVLDSCNIVTPITYIPYKYSKKIKKMLSNFDINVLFVENIEDYIYYGEKNDKAILDSLIYYIDYKGNYIYFLDNNNLIYNNVFLIKNHAFYSLSIMELNNIININKYLFIEDYIFNTNLPIEKDYYDYFYNNFDKLDLYKIINRITISKTTNN